MKRLKSCIAPESRSRLVHVVHVRNREVSREMLQNVNSRDERIFKECVLSPKKSWEYSPKGHTEACAKD